MKGERDKGEQEAPMRSDARRNRDDLLAAAVRALTKDADASLEGIARAAGVGIGTLYRHFPTREALVEAANRSEIAKLCDAAPELLERYRPDEALARFLDLLIDHMESKPGMVQAMRAIVAIDRTPLNHSLAMVSAAVAPIIEAGRSDGLLRDDFTVEDFIVIKGAVVLAGPEKARRLAVLLVDGVRSPAGASKEQKPSTKRRPSRAKG